MAEKSEAEASKARDKLSDFSQVLMSINNLGDKCQNYTSKLQYQLNMEGYTHKPKSFFNTFNITDDRVKFAIR